MLAWWHQSIRRRASSINLKTFRICLWFWAYKSVNFPICGQFDLKQLAFEIFITFGIQLNWSRSLGYYLVLFTHVRITDTLWRPEIFVNSYPSHWSTWKYINFNLLVTISSLVQIDFAVLSFFATFRTLNSLENQQN